ncbi:MAG: alpha/beta hydrolase [Cytophagales bacterium]|nr:alpha/beta hydrolase [Cytophagales bacterium]
MTGRRFFIFLFTFFSTMTFAQETIKLWPGEVPFSNGKHGKEELLDRGRITNIQEPEITVYLPETDRTTGTAVVICPGGGYRILAMQHEGHDVARWLNSIGIAGIVVKYRLPTSENITQKSEVAMADAQRAVRMTRYHAERWGIDPGKIGIMGFSAGGHLASTVGTHYDYGLSRSEDPIQKVSCRPDFMVLIYPVVSMTEDFSHSGSVKSLLGEKPSEIQKLRFSNERQVTSDTPPTILIHSSDDHGVHPANSIAFYEALNAFGVTAELHIFNSGAHGYGLGRKDGTSHNHWPNTVEAFIRDVKN